MPRAAAGGGGCDAQIYPHTKRRNTHTTHAPPHNTRARAQSDGSTVKATSLDTATQNYQFVGSDGEWADVVAVRAQSTAGFTLTVRGREWGKEG